MALPFSNSHIERLGTRIVASFPDLDSGDASELKRLLVEHGRMLDDAVGRVTRATEVVPTSRVKSFDTTVDKLRRSGGSHLKGMQDLAGMRIVGDFDLAGQDRVVEQVVAEFQNEAKSPRVIDRRIEPSHGYRAVHVVVYQEAVPVEVQVRTRFQHGWAEMFEKMGDVMGRGIRYGEAPLELTVQEQLADAGGARELVSKANRLREKLLRDALGLSVSIGEAERLASEQGPGLSSILLGASAIFALEKIGSDIEKLNELQASMQELGVIQLPYSA